MRGLAALLVFLMLGGLLLLVTITDSIDRRWTRNRTVLRQPIVQGPPFIYADTQCRDCGVDGELLSLDEKLCLMCHEVKHG